MNPPEWTLKAEFRSRDFGDGLELHTATASFTVGVQVSDKARSMAPNLVDSLTKTDLRHALDERIYGDARRALVEIRRFLAYSSRDGVTAQRGADLVDRAMESLKPQPFERGL